MKLAALCALFLVLFGCSHSLFIDIDLGALLDLDIGENIIQFITGEELTINIDQAVKVKLEVATSVEAKTYPEGFLSAALGYDLTVEGSADAIVNGTLTTKELASSFVDKIGTEFKTVSAVIYDAAVDFYHEVDICKYDSDTKKATIDFFGRGEIIVIGKKEGDFKMPTLFERPRKIVANTEYALEFPQGFLLDLSAEAEFDLAVKKSSKSDLTFEGRAALGIYYDVSQTKETAVDAVLKVQYSAKQVTDAMVTKVENLRLAFYNEAKKAWEFVANGEVDVEANVVVQSTTHFSQWGVFEAKDSDLNGAGALKVSLLLLAAVFAFLF